MDAARFMRQPQRPLMGQANAEPSGRYVQANNTQADMAFNLNRQAAEAGARDQAMLAQETAAGTPVERGEVDTATPGGGSGRRRRNATAVGSIRI